MNDIYRYTIADIERAMKEINNPDDRYKFISKTKREFAANNTGSQADTVIKWLEDEQSLLEMQVKYSSRKSETQIVKGSPLPIKQWKLKENVGKEQIYNHYNWLVSKEWTDSPWKDFKAVFSGENYRNKLPVDWKPIRWLLTNIQGKKAGKPNSTALAATIRTFLNVGTSQDWKRIMSDLFVDQHGDKILPALDQSMEKLNKYLPRSDEKFQ